MNMEGLCNICMAFLGVFLFTLFEVVFYYPSSVTALKNEVTRIAEVQQKSFPSHPKIKNASLNDLTLRIKLW